MFDKDFTSNWVELFRKKITHQHIDNLINEVKYTSSTRKSIDKFRRISQRLATFNISCYLYEEDGMYCFDILYPNNEQQRFACEEIRKLLLQVQDKVEEIIDNSLTTTTKEERRNINRKYRL